MNTSSRIDFVANVHNVLPSLSPAMIETLRDKRCYGSPATRAALHERGLIAPALSESKRRYVIWLRTVFGFRTLETMFPEEFWQGAVGNHSDEIFNRCPRPGT